MSEKPLPEIAEVNASGNDKVLRVIHVDDDVFELEWLQNILESHSTNFKFVVESFSSPNEYINRISVLPRPDIAILDLHLGHEALNGIDLIKITRNIEREELTIFMCSTASGKETITDCLLAGANGFISKNDSKEDLLRLIQTAYDSICLIPAV